MITRPEQTEIQERLQQLADRNGGRLTPQAVVDDARDLDSPLHKQFEWNQDKGFDLYLLDRARTIIRTVEVVIRTNEKSVVRVPCYVRDPSAGRNEQGYIAMKRLRTEEDMAREAVVSEFARAADVLRRARTIAAALEIRGEIDTLIGAVEGMRDKVEKPGGKKAPVPRKTAARPRAR